MFCMLQPSGIVPPVPHTRSFRLPYLVASKTGYAPSDVPRAVQMSEFFLKQIMPEIAEFRGYSVFHTDHDCARCVKLLSEMLILLLFSIL